MLRNRNLNTPGPLLAVHDLNTTLPYHGEKVKQYFERFSVKDRIGLDPELVWPRSLCSSSVTVFLYGYSVVGSSGQGLFREDLCRILLGCRGRLGLPVPLGLIYWMI